MTPKFIKKYMRLARLVGSDQIHCLSRGIGSVIVNPIENRILGTGYNGPPKSVPHCDSYNYLEEIVYPQLSNEDKKYIFNDYKEITTSSYFLKSARDFADYYNGCKVCPRRLVGAKSGERLNLCSCAHSEQNAIINAAQSVFGSYLFCWCGPPCFDICAKAIVNAGIIRVYALKTLDSAYNENKTRWLFSQAGVELFELEESWINDDSTG
jgi:dCMP deaminase